MLRSFHEGADIHLATAAKVYNKALQEVSQQERRFAKTINFGLIYGMSAFGLANQLKISNQQAQDFMKLYFDQFPQVIDFIENTKKQALENLFVETLCGRRIEVPEIASPKKQVKNAQERLAVNAVLQGSAADIIKKAMIAAYEYCQLHENELFLLLQIHDELIFESHENCLEEHGQALQKIMSLVENLQVPLVVDLHTGSHWGEL